MFTNHSFEHFVKNVKNNMANISNINLIFHFSIFIYCFSFIINEGIIFFGGQIP